MRCYYRGGFMKYRYLFILEIAPVEVGKTNDELPSHLTLMSRFISELMPSQLSKAVRPLFDKTASINLTFSETTELGPKKLTVRLVEYSDQLRSLHNALLKSLRSLDAEFEYPQFVGTGHKPHVTAREGTNFSPGDRIMVSHACLVEVINSKRIIRSKFELGGKEVNGQGFSQKYTIIQLLESMPEGAQFSFTDWPLHVTIVDTFATDWDVSTMIRELGGLLADHSQAASVAESDTFFGPDKQTQVTLLQKTDSLTRLHNDATALLKNGGLRLNDPQFAGEGFVPHSTVQKQVKLHKGDQVVFNALTIIDMFPDKDPYQRKVLKTIRIDQQ